VRARPGLCRQAGRHTPRHQARQHPDDGRVRYQDFRFRRGPDAGVGNDAGERDRLACVHVARAGEGRDVDSPDRHLLAGRRDVSSFSPGACRSRAPTTTA
jgi:hypothetical protein